MDNTTTEWPRWQKALIGWLGAILIVFYLGSVVSKCSAQCQYPGPGGSPISPTHPQGVTSIFDSCNVGAGGCGLGALRLSMDAEPRVGTHPSWTITPFGQVSEWPVPGATVVVAFDGALLPVPFWIVRGTLCATFVPFSNYTLAIWPLFAPASVPVQWPVPVLPVLVGLTVYSQAIVVDPTGRVQMTQAVEVRPW